MMPTLLVGDFILVNKFAYGLRWPVLDSKFLDLGEPQRGDVAVFRFPLDPGTDYIKRIVGVPGDEIAYRNKTLYVNGQAVPQTTDGLYTGVGAGAGMTGSRIADEKLGEVEHRILTHPRAPDLAPGCYSSSRARSRSRRAIISPWATIATTATTAAVGAWCRRATWSARPSPSG